jgi:DNA-binding transcriptional LysR family regulator
MDVDLLKTFVEVYHTRHFARAADNLFITPSAVSARVRLLESQLGIALFLRERNNIQLTDAGERFLGHARNILRLWEQARYDATIDAGTLSNLGLLIVPGLWDAIQPDWLQDLHRLQPDLALRIETLNSMQITSRLQQNNGDLGFLLEPTLGPELHLLDLGELELLMVSTTAGQSAQEALRNRYAMVDWNTSFHTQHTNAFPDAPPPRLWVSTGRIAYDLLLSTGGAAYLPRQMIAAAMQQGQLHEVATAPHINLRIYAAYPIWSSRKGLVEQVVTAVRAYL